MRIPINTVAGFIAIGRSDKSVGEVINIGSNYEISICETLQMIASIMGADVEVESDKERFRPRSSEVERLWADNSKAKKLLGWEPKYVELSSIIETAWAWHQKHPQGY